MYQHPDKLMFLVWGRGAFWLKYIEEVIAKIINNSNYKNENGRNFALMEIYEILVKINYKKQDYQSTSKYYDILAELGYFDKFIEESNKLRNHGLAISDMMDYEIYTIMEKMKNR